MAERAIIAATPAIKPCGLVIAALVVRGRPTNLARILAIPVFILAVAAIWLLARASGTRGPASPDSVSAAHRRFDFQSHKRTVRHKVARYVGGE